MQERRGAWMIPDAREEMGAKIRIWSVHAIACEPDSVSYNSNP